MRRLEAQKSGDLFSRHAHIIIINSISKFSFDKKAQIAGNFCNLCFFIAMYLLKTFRHRKGFITLLYFLLPHIPSPLHRTLHRVFLPHLQTGPVVEVHIP